MSKPQNPVPYYGPHRVSGDTWIACAPFEKLLNIDITTAGDGEATLCMPFIPDLAQGFGLMHGGALTSLADTSVVMAIKSLLPPGSRFATMRLEVDFLKPVVRGIVTAHARITRRENRDLYCESAIVDDRAEPILNCSCRFRVAKDVPIDSLTGMPPDSSNE